MTKLSVLSYYLDVFERSIKHVLIFNWYQTVWQGIPLLNGFIIKSISCNVVNLWHPEIIITTSCVMWMYISGLIEKRRGNEDTCCNIHYVQYSCQSFALRRPNLVSLLFLSWIQTTYSILIHFAIWMFYYHISTNSTRFCDDESNNCIVHCVFQGRIEQWNNIAWQPPGSVVSMPEKLWRVSRSVPFCARLYATNMLSQTIQSYTDVKT